MKLSNMIIKKPDPQVLYGKEKPDILYDPRKAPVMQVKAEKIITSETYATKFSLRFPRVEMLRPDKDSTCCTSIEEIQKIIQESGGKLATPMDLDLGNEQSRKRKRTANNRKKIGVAEIYQQQKGLEFEKVDSLCLKDKIVVVEPVNKAKKQKIERLVVKHGGKVEQNIKVGRSDIYVETGMKVKFKGIFDRKEADIVVSSWLLSQEDETQIRMPLPHEYISWLPVTEDSWVQKCDEFLDPFMEKADKDGLHFSMEKVRNANRVLLGLGKIDIDPVTKLGRQSISNFNDLGIDIIQKGSFKIVTIGKTPLSILYYDPDPERKYFKKKSLSP